MDSTPHCSRVVPHPSTEQAQTALTSVFGWEPVDYDWYGRIRWTWNLVLRNGKKVRKSEPSRQARVKSESSQSQARVKSQGRTWVRIKSTRSTLKQPIFKIHWTWSDRKWDNHQISKIGPKRNFLKVKNWLISIIHNWWVIPNIHTVVWLVWPIHISSDGVVGYHARLTRARSRVRSSVWALFFFFNWKTKTKK